MLLYYDALGMFSAEDFFLITVGKLIWTVPTAQLYVINCYKKIKKKCILENAFDRFSRWWVVPVTAVKYNSNDIYIPRINHRIIYKISRDERKMSIYSIYLYIYRYCAVLCCFNVMTKSWTAVYGLNKYTWTVLFYFFLKMFMWIYYLQWANII